MISTSSATLGATYEYTVETIPPGEPNQLRLRMKIGTSTIAITSWSPWGEWIVNPTADWSSQWSAETFYPESDIPGSLGQPARFSDLEVQYCCSDYFVNNGEPLAAVNEVPGRYILTAVINNTFDSWTSN